VHLYNTRPGLILSDMILTLPFTIWTVTTLMRTLPKKGRRTELAADCGLHGHHQPVKARAARPSAGAATPRTSDPICTR
jgi:hypothetical protein